MTEEFVVVDDPGIEGLLMMMEIRSMLREIDFDAVEKVMREGRFMATLTAPQEIKGKLFKGSKAIEANLNLMRPLQAEIARIDEEADDDS